MTFLGNLSLNTKENRWNIRLKEHKKGLAFEVNVIFLMTSGRGGDKGLTTSKEIVKKHVYLQSFAPGNLYISLNSRPLNTFSFPRSITEYSFEYLLSKLWGIKRERNSFFMCRKKIRNLITSLAPIQKHVQQSVFSKRKKISSSFSFFLSFKTDIYIFIPWTKIVPFKMSGVLSIICKAWDFFLWADAISCWVLVHSSFTAS